VGAFWSNYKGALKGLWSNKFGVILMSYTELDEVFGMSTRPLNPSQSFCRRDGEAIWAERSIEKVALTPLDAD
jgi:hypothetical protein